MQASGVEQVAYVEPSQMQVALRRTREFFDRTHITQTFALICRKLFHPVDHKAGEAGWGLLRNRRQALLCNNQLGMHDTRPAIWHLSSALLASIPPLRHRIPVIPLSKSAAALWHPSLTQRTDHGRRGCKSSPDLRSSHQCTIIRKCKNKPL